jgi:hypothetical protein
MKRESGDRRYPTQPMVTLLPEHHPAQLPAITHAVARAAAGPAHPAPQATTIPSRQTRRLGRVHAANEFAVRVGDDRRPGRTQRGAQPHSSQLIEEPRP